MEKFDRVAIRRATGYSTAGTLTASADGGFEWSGGNERAKIPRADVQTLTWTPLNSGFQLAVTKTDGNVINFTGLRHEALEKLQHLGFGTLKREEFSMKGRNWGKLEVDGKTVAFVDGDRPIFKIPLPDVSSLQYGKDDVTFEFGAVEANDEEDVLVGMSFHVPAESEDFPRTHLSADGVEENPELADPDLPSNKDLPAKRFFNMIFPHIDAAGKAERPIGTFEEVTALVPRGRFEVQLHHSYLKMLGQAQDFKIKYKYDSLGFEFLLQSFACASAILHLFILPKPNPAMTVVVMTLDPPIRKGQTFYNHVLFQFDTEVEMSLELNLTQEELDAKNQQHGGMLTKEMSSMAFDVFAACLKGLSGARLTRPRTFANAAKDGSCVRCSYKNDEGFLFPLERAFFYIHKPPLCVTHDEIDSIEFQRQATNVVSASVKTFDLCIRTHQGAEHQFRGIQRNEWQVLFNFIASKNLRVENVDSVRQGPSQHTTSLPLADIDLDNGADDSDDSDPDFNMNQQEEDHNDSETNGGSSSGAEMVDEAEISDPEPAVEDTKEAGQEREEPQQSQSQQKKYAGKAEPDRQKRKSVKKDKNAPKKNRTAFLFYSQAIGDSVRQENPGTAFGDIQKIVGEKWRVLEADEKKKYQEMAEKDKARYKEEKAKYLATLQPQAPQKDEKV